jgi:hypothetical protein
MTKYSIVANVKYLKYVLRHKWFVAVECFRRGQYWRGIVHDLSKFRPSEWFPYVEYFCTDRKSTEWFDLYAQYGLAELAPWGASVLDRFDAAWLLHQRRNPHHWQYWMLREDDGGNKLIPMPHEYLVEMLCDWIAAGKAQGKPDTKAWYIANREKIVLRSRQRAWVEMQLGIGGKGAA